MLTVKNMLYSVNKMSASLLLAFIFSSSYRNYRPPPGLKQYYKLVQSHSLPHKVFEEKVQHLLELFSKIPFNQALVFSNLHTR